jgi:hypothetical protein
MPGRLPRTNEQVRAVRAVSGTHMVVVDKAQRMYDSRQFTMAEIATSCGGVTPMTIYRNIRICTVDGTAADVA